MEVKMLLLEEEKNYQVRDVLDMFPVYYGMSLEELLSLFNHYEVLNEVVIQEYMTQYPEKMWENRFYVNDDMQLIIHERMKDYQIFKKNLEVLNKKAICYLNLLQSMESDSHSVHFDKGVEYYYDLINQLNIVLTGNETFRGSELNRILIPLYHSVYHFLKILNKINCLDTYHKQSYDSFARCYGADKIYFTENILLTDGLIFDKTSIYAHHEKCLVRK